MILTKLAVMVGLLSADYKGISWGTQMSIVTKQSKPGKKENCSVLYGDRILADRRMQEMVTEQNLLPGLEISPNTLYGYGSNAYRPTERYMKRYKISPFNDVCGIFFDKKLVGVFNRPTLSNSEAESELRSKYGRLLELRRGVFRLETRDTHVFFVSVTSPKRGEAPEILYLSKDQSSLKSAFDTDQSNHVKSENNRINKVKEKARDSI